MCYKPPFYITQKRMKNPSGITPQELVEHNAMVREVQQLPEFSTLFAWTPAQIQCLQNSRWAWHYIGSWLDFRQLQQVGYLPNNPLTQVANPVLQEEFKAYGDYYFSLLQVFIEYFGKIQAVAKDTDREFPFPHPRALLTQSCREQANVIIQQLQSNTGEAQPMDFYRTSQSRLGKFYRGSLPPSELEEIYERLIKSQCWTDFSLAAMWGRVGLSYLGRSSSWKGFKAAHKALLKLHNTPKLKPVAWCKGNPVLNSTKQRVAYIPIHEGTPS